MNDERDAKPNTMNNTTAHRAPAGSTIQRIMIKRFHIFAILILALLAFTMPPLHAQPATPAPNTPASISDPSTINSQPSTPSITALQPVIDGLLGKYGWLTT